MHLILGIMYGLAFTHDLHLKTGLHLPFLCSSTILPVLGLLSVLPGSLIPAAAVRAQ